MLSWICARLSSLAPTVCCFDFCCCSRIHLLASSAILSTNSTRTLLRAIEELTLYTFAQEKKLKIQEDKINTLEKQQKEIEELKKQNSKIDKQQKEIDELKALVQKLLKDKN